ncbi:hypothetical protein [Komagataeibacter diospyri]|uniref:hypothetical protein n=1 Tax=Komagataeibacter diospyri TaxID=1932662 RepID=UPI0011418FD0|nr:hypothetical protein [Komagataeibacter diospyri]
MMMAWKSTTFKRSTTPDQFLVTASAVSDTSKGGSGRRGWKRIKDAGTPAPKTAGEAKQASSLAVAKHRDAMSGVLLEAKKIADDRREMLNSIKDPDLKRSAAR